MNERLAALLFCGATLACSPVDAHPFPSPLVDVSVEVDGVRAPLHPARDGSGRLYLEARDGAEYAVRLENRTAERVGVVVLVDGLNVISAVREDPGSGGPGRMYVLDPWDSTTVRGWRSSLEEVHAFTFEDEGRSYAARTGKSNRKMGWIEVAAYRDRERPVPVEPQVRGYGEGRPDKDEDRRQAPAGAARDRAEAPSATGAYPGTGWGDRHDDPVRLVHFEPESRPAQLTTIRYEYAATLRALGLLPRHDRLHEREHAVQGFVPPPPGR